MAKKVSVKVRKRKPQDSTLRNVRTSRSHEKALTKRIARLEAKVGRLTFYLRAAARR